MAEYHWIGLSSRFQAKVSESESEILEQFLDGIFRNFGRSLLTPREREVVGLVLRGHSSVSIAKVLDVATGTVKIHRRNIYSKLGISSQAQLFSLFLSMLSEREDK